MGNKILADVLALLRDAPAISDLSDRAAVKAFVAKVAPDLVDLAFDAGGFDKVSAAICECSAAEVDAAISAALAVPRQQGTFGAIGDGTILKKLLANLPSIISAVVTIIGLFGQKTVTPVTSVTPADPSPAWAG